MIACPACGGRLAPHSKDTLETGEIRRRFRCTCCLKFRNAYSLDGEVWRWDKRPVGRPIKDFSFA